MTKIQIPLHKPFWGKEEENAAITAMRSGTGIGDLEFSEKLAKTLQKIISAKYVLPTGSGTAALELACACIINKGDEVILPSFTFSSSANAIILAEGKPVFADIELSTYNINPKSILKLLTKKTKAIMVVHYAGMACDMKSILKIAKKHKLFIIEDAAHAVGAKYNGKYLGTIGDIGCFSFHGTKNIASGEGGAFITKNIDIKNKAEIIREKGTNRSSFMRGERNMYSWVDKGSSLILSDILSAIALEQIKKIDQITKLRNNIANYYLKKLQPLSKRIILPQISQGTKPNWHIFAIRVPSSKRDLVISSLRNLGIHSAFHFLPLHSSLMGKKLGYKKNDLPITEEVSDTLIRLPIYPNLKKVEIDYIVEALEKIL